MHSNVIKSMVDEINQKSNLDYKSISNQEYEAWKYLSILDGLRGHRFGQSFCHHFDVTDYILYYTRDINRCDKHIKQYYVES